MLISDIPETEKRYFISTYYKKKRIFTWMIFKWLWSFSNKQNLKHETAMDWYIDVQKPENKTQIGTMFLYIYLLGI